MSQVFRGDARTRKLREDLPGHADEVYTVDWSPDGAWLAVGASDLTVLPRVERFDGPATESFESLSHQNSVKFLSKFV